MAESTKPGPLGRNVTASPRLPGALGRGGAGGPDGKFRLVGNTPGALGRNDWADPDHTASPFRLRPPSLLENGGHSPFDLSVFKLSTSWSAELASGRPPLPGGGDDAYQGIPDTQLTACATGDETVFKRRVYRAACRRAARKRKYFAGVPAGGLAVVEGDYKMRSDAAAAARKLLKEMRDTLKKEQTAKLPHALKVTLVALTSGYRDPKKDFKLWDDYYSKYYKQTKSTRHALAGGEHGDAAVEELARYIGKYKAAPGYSNHTHGLAFDITTTEGGVIYTADKDQNSAWEKTWLRQWLLANAGRFGFKKLETEAWHWDYKP